MYICVLDNTIVFQFNEVENYLRLSAYPSGSKLQLLLLVPHLNRNRCNIDVIIKINKEIKTTHDYWN